MQNCSKIIAVSVLSIGAAFSIGGLPIRGPYGRPCLPGGGAETQGADGGKDVSDPINLATGDFQHSQTDLVIPGRGLDFEIKRFYRSYTGIQAIDDYIFVYDDMGPVMDFLDIDDHTPLGDHWDFNYNMRVSLYEPEFDPLIGTPEGTPLPGGGQQGIEHTEQLPNRISYMTGTGRLSTFLKYSPSGNYSDGNPALYSHKHIDMRMEYTAHDEPVRVIDTDMTVYEFFAGYSAVHTLESLNNRTTAHHFIRIPS